MSIRGVKGLNRGEFSGMDDRLRFAGGHLFRFYCVFEPYFKIWRAHDHLLASNNSGHSMEWVSAKNVKIIEPWGVSGMDDGSRFAVGLFSFVYFEVESVALSRSQTD